ncbi:MAG: FMN-binding protein [Clostridiales bacterium]|nr:FMN-binding protein [Clostridiales bacterium]
MENKSSIIKDALALFIVTLASALALSFAYEITKEPIYRQEMDKKLAGYKVVYPEAVSLVEDEELMQLVAETDLTALDASYKDVTIDEINKAYDNNDNLIGYILKVTSKGYAAPISLAVGYSIDGVVKGIETLSINETAGLGMNAAEPSFKKQFANKQVEQFETTKSGATEEHQINVISSATITTDAVVYGVNAGIGFIQEYASDLGGGANE